MDIGAPRSLIGLDQAKLYCKESGINLKLFNSNNKFLFGTYPSKSLGKMKLLMPTPGNSIQIDVDVVEENVPLLIGIDVMDKHSIQPLILDNALESKLHKWKIPLIRKFDHIYFEWRPANYSIFYSRQQLERLHRHFVHPSARKLYELLKKAHIEDLPAETLDTLKDISEKCETCSLYKSRQSTFQIRDMDEVKFNHRIVMDIMYLPDKTEKSRPVLHIVDAGTRFSAAAFLPKIDTTTIWHTFLKIWSTIYIGFPECILTDQGSVFISKEWNSNCDLAQIRLIHTGTESHNSLGLCEKYHSTLRTIFQKLRCDFPNLPCDIALAKSVQAMNETVGPHGLVPSLLVFGVIPKIPNISQYESPNQKERLKAAQTARATYEKIVAKSIIDRGIKKIPPPSSDHVYRPGDFAYVYREGIKQYTGPHMIATVDGKSVRLHLGEKFGPRPFNISQIRPAHNNPHSEENLEKLLNSHGILWTEIIPTGDDRESLFHDAKKNEILGLIERGTFRITLTEEIDKSEKPNILPSRFVLAIKHTDGGDIFKARFVIGGHRDREKSSLVHHSYNLKQSSVKLLLALATILGFEVWDLDVKQAYLQSGSKLQRAVYIKPDIIELDQNELIQILKPLYGLSESGDYWCETNSKFHIHELLMQQATGDFGLFFKTIMDKLVCISGSYVDDILQAGTAEEKKIIQQKFKEKFDATFSDKKTFTYTGMKVDTSNPQLRTLSQSEYINRLEYLDKNASFKKYRSLRARLIWVVNTRPDICAAVSIFSTITESCHKMQDNINLNKIVKHLKSTCNIKLKYPKLDLSSLRLLVYSDSSFNNREGNKSQLGYIIILADETNNCCILQYSSKKSHRVTRSSMAAETLAFVDAFDNAILTKHDLRRLLNLDIPIIMLMDSEALFRILTRSRYTTERRLEIDIAAAREAYGSRKISNIAWIHSQDNYADDLTKINGNGSLLQLLQTHKIDHVIRQWIIESHSSKISTTCQTSTEKTGCVK